MIKPVKCGCGGEAIIYINGARQAKIYCEKCGIESNVFATKYEAITAWNRAMGERTAKVIKHHYDFNPYKDNFSHGLGGTELLCSHCKKKVIVSDEYCSHCGCRLDLDEDIPMEYFESGGR